MRIKKKVEKAVKFQAVKLIAHFFYFAGLTALIPLVPLLLSPQQLVEAKYAFGIALVMIFFGFLLVFWVSHSKKTALRALGMMTLIPGLLAVFFSYTPPGKKAALLRMFGEATPYLERWIETYVPTAWLLAGMYTIVGVALVWFSYRVKK